MKQLVIEAGKTHEKTSLWNNWLMKLLIDVTTNWRIHQSKKEAMDEKTDEESTSGWTPQLMKLSVDEKKQLM